MLEKQCGDLKRGTDQHIFIKSWNFSSDNESLKIEISNKSFKDDAKRQPGNRFFDAYGERGFWLNEGTTVTLFDKDKTIAKTIRISEKIKCDYVCSMSDDETTVQVKFALVFN